MLLTSKTVPRSASLLLIGLACSLTGAMAAPGALPQDDPQPVAADLDARKEESLRTYLEMRATIVPCEVMTYPPPVGTQTGSYASSAPVSSGYQSWAIGIDGRTIKVEAFYRLSDGAMDADKLPTPESVQNGRIPSRAPPFVGHPNSVQQAARQITTWNTWLRAKLGLVDQDVTEEDPSLGAWADIGLDVEPCP